MTSSPSDKDPKKNDDLIIPHDEASTAFVQGLVARGEAVRLTPGASMPAGATHEIVGETEAGHPILRRRRFSLS